MSNGWRLGKYKDKEPKEGSGPGKTFDPEGSTATAAQAALIYSQLGMSRVVFHDLQSWERTVSGPQRDHAAYQSILKVVCYLYYRLSLSFR